MVEYTMMKQKKPPSALCANKTSRPGNTCPQWRCQQKLSGRHRSDQGPTRGRTKIAELCRRAVQPSGPSIPRTTDIKPTVAEEGGGAAREASEWENRERGEAGGRGLRG